MTYQTQWRKEDELRVILMDCLYIIDGRHDPKHPQHATYTGLWRQYKSGEVKP